MYTLLDALCTYFFVPDMWHENHVVFVQDAKYFGYELTKYTNTLSQKYYTTVHTKNTL